MRTYDVILSDNSALVSKERLIEMYNEAVQEIWYLSGRLEQTRKENEALWKSCVELMDQIYG